MQRHALVLGLAVVLSGCTQALPGRGPSFFGLTAVDAVAPTVIEAKRTVEGPHGSLTLDLSAIAQRLVQRKVLYTVADIDHLEITITQPPSFTTSATIAKADLASGHATYTFTNLPGGAIFVDIQAKDASGTVIGQDTHSVSITANQTTSYSPALLLYPSAAAPTGGGSGGTSSTDLTLDLDVADAGTSAIPTVLASVPVTTNKVAVDPAGNLWAHGTTPSSSGDAYGVFKYSSDGALQPIQSGPLEPQIAAWAVQPIRFDAAGHPWIGTGDVWVPWPNKTDVLAQSGQDLAVDASGDVWILGATKLQKFTAAGNLLAEVPLPAGEGAATTVRINPQGELVVLRAPVEDPTATTFCTIYRFAPDGTLLGTYVRPNALASDKNIWYYSEMDLDPQGNVWLMSAGDGRLFKLSPTLTELANAPLFPAPLALSVDRDGKAWVITDGTLSGAPTYLTRYGTNTRPEATAIVSTTAFAALEYFIAGAGGNACWVPLGDHVDKLTF